jgi:hypothetical protein
LCVLNNGDHDKMEFLKSTWKNKVNSSYFVLPKGKNIDCSKNCGEAPQPYDCKSHYLRHTHKARP